MDDAAFLAALADDPDDDATLLVYADWLEERGDPRAAFLRAQERSRKLTHSRSGFVRACRETISLGVRLPLEWLMLVSRPRLRGTVWAGTDAGGSLEPSFHIYWFHPDGRLSYATEADEEESLGTWRQVGPLALLEMNDHYAYYEGLIGGRRAAGRAANVEGSVWDWDLGRMTEERARRLAPFTLVRRHPRRSPGP